MRIDWNFPAGMDELMKLVAAKEGTAVDAIKECIVAGQTELFDKFKEGLERHRDEGDAIESLFKPKPQIDGNEISGQVGSFAGKNLAGFIHAAYQEYGAFVRSGTPHVTFAADPWKRPAEDAMKTRFKAIVKRIMQGRLVK